MNEQVFTTRVEQDETDRITRTEAMLHNMKKFMQVSAAAIIAISAVALGSAAIAYANDPQPFKVGETDLAAGGVPNPEYPNGGKSSGGSYDEIGETDRAAAANANRRRTGVKPVVVVKAGFTDMSAGGLPRPEEFRSGPRSVYTGVGETDQAGGIAELQVVTDGLVYAVPPRDDEAADEALVLRRTKPDINGPQVS